MTTSKEEFSKSYKKIKEAYEIAILAANENQFLGKNDHEKCIRLIDDVFEIPLKLPNNFDDVAEQWASICQMVQHLADVKQKLQLSYDAQHAPAANALISKKSACTAAAVLVGGAAVSFLAPGVAGIVVSRIGTATMSLGRWLTPLFAKHGMGLLKKTFGRKGKENLKLADLVTLTSSALSAANALKKHLDEKSAK